MIGTSVWPRKKKMYRLTFGLLVVLLIGMLVFVAASPNFKLVRYDGETVVRGIGDLHGR